MGTFVNIRTFLLAARLGSFAAVARSLSVAPSVVSKRIGQLEHEFKATLFHRTTRELLLSVDGSRLMPQFQKIITDVDALRDAHPQEEINGHLRVDAPGTVTSRVLGPIFCDFLARHPGIDLDLRLIDRLDNPLDKGCDLAVGTRPSTFSHIRDVPLMPYTCAAYASSEFVAQHGAPQHPHDLVKYSCLVSLLYGHVWHFYGDVGDFAVTVRPRLSVNDTIVLREAVRRNLGIAVLPTLLVESDVKAGRIKLLLPSFRPPPLWLKALVPQRSVKPSVRALVDFLRLRLAPAQTMLLAGDNAEEAFGRDSD
jgi:DNA-binding transcriptional LysR family regulator